MAKRELEYYRQRAEGLIRSDDVLRQLLAEAEAEERELARTAQEARETALEALSEGQAVDQAGEYLTRLSEALTGEPTTEQWRGLIAALVHDIRVETVADGRRKKPRISIRMRAGEVAVERGTTTVLPFWCYRLEAA